MIRSELVDQLYQGSNLDESTVQRATDTIIESLTTALCSHQRIEVRGFGSLEVVEQKPRLCRNPKTGEKMMTTPAPKVKFKLGKQLKDRINQAPLPPISE